MMVPLFQVGNSDERSFSGIVNREPFQNTLYLISHFVRLLKIVIYFLSLHENMFCCVH